MQRQYEPHIFYSVLQLTAIVYYNEVEIISIISILISMTSVCSKVLVLALGLDEHVWQFRLFGWLSFVIDFFAVFFIVSFSFYSPVDTELQEYFLTFRWIVIWEFLICIAPFAVIGSIGMHIYWSIHATYGSFNGRYGCCAPLAVIIGLICITFLWVIGLFCTIIAMQILCCGLMAFLCLLFSLPERTGYKKNMKEFYNLLRDWIFIEATKIIDINSDKGPKQLLMNKKQNLILRLCIANDIILKQKDDPTQQSLWSKKWGNIKDPLFIKYLEQESKTQYKNVSFSQLRKNNEKPNIPSPMNHQHATILRTFYYDYYSSIWQSEWRRWKTSRSVWDFRDYSANFVALATIFYITYLSGPFYILSRFFNALLPFIFVIYLAVNGVVLWVDVDIFQVIMWCIYVTLLIIWLILCGKILFQTFYEYHLLPATSYLTASDDKSENAAAIKQIKDEYLQMSTYPILQNFIIKKYGSDIGNVILEYYLAIDLSEQSSV